MRVTLLTQGGKQVVGSLIQHYLMHFPELIISDSKDIDEKDDLILYIFTENISKSDLYSFKDVCIRSRILNIPLFYISTSIDFDKNSNLIENIANVYNPENFVGFYTINLDSLIDILTRRTGLSPT